MDCDFSIRVVHASAEDLDLERLRGSELKKTGTARSALSLLVHMTSYDAIPASLAK